MKASVPQLIGIDHVKLAVNDLPEALAWYGLVLNAERIPRLDHIDPKDGSVYAHIMEVPGLGAKIEVRLNPEQAEKHRGFDPLTIAVKDRVALQQWAALLDEHNMQHSSEIVALEAWILVTADPSGNRIRLYTEERHGSEIKPESGNPWLLN